MKWDFLYQITAASRTPDYGATAPRSPFSLSSTEFVNTHKNKIPGYPIGTSRIKLWFVLYLNDVNAVWTGFMIRQSGLCAGRPHRKCVQLSKVASFCSMTASASVCASRRVTTVIFAHNGEYLVVRLRIQQNGRNIELLPYCYDCTDYLVRLNTCRKVMALFNKQWHTFNHEVRISCTTWRWPLSSAETCSCTLYRKYFIFYQ